MNKQQFIENQPVKASLAEMAWEESNGEPEGAQELLEPAIIWIKGRFFGGEIGGIFLIEWDLQSQELVENDCIVLNKNRVKGAAPRLSPQGFKDKFNKIARSSGRRAGIEQALKLKFAELWEDPQSRINRLIEEESFDGIAPIHKTVLRDTLEVELTDSDIHYTLRRKIEITRSDEEDKEPDSKQLFVPCEIIINPVKGLSINQLNRGDLIFARPGELTEESADNAELRMLHNKVKEQADEDSRYLTVKLLSGKAQDSGKVLLTFKITNEINGRALCGRDVKLLTPAETLQKRAENSPANLLTTWLKYLSTIAIGIFLLVIVIWLLFSLF